MQLLAHTSVSQLISRSSHLAAPTSVRACRSSSTAPYRPVHRRLPSIHHSSTGSERLPSPSQRYSSHIAQWLAVVSQPDQGRAQQQVSPDSFPKLLFVEFRTQRTNTPSICAASLAVRVAVFHDNLLTSIGVVSKGLLDKSHESPSLRRVRSATGQSPELPRWVVE